MEDTISILRGLKERFEIHHGVRITDGALESFLGVVEEIDLERQKVRVIVSMFGRETPVELDLDQIESI